MAWLGCQRQRKGGITLETEFLISNGGKAYIPVLEEGVEWSTERRSTPGKLTFKVVCDDIVSFGEGSAVRFKVDGEPVFFGFVFSQKRSKDNIITVTAYDQLRYLKNKDTRVYSNITATQLIKTIADDFALNVGTLEETRYVIASRVEDNTALFDMIENALDLTLANSGEMFVLYDDFGKLTMKNISSMYVGKQGAYLIIDEESGENYEYTSSIDNNTYNKVKLVYDNEESGKRDVYIAQDTAHINEWGVLQYYDTLSEGENGQAKADALLKLYNSKTRNLKITNALGDVRVRAGSMVAVMLDLGDCKVQNFMLVESAKHIFRNNQHLMNLTLRGGEFIA